MEMECEMGSLPRPRAIFVSAAEADREFAERLCADMERADLSPFLDRKTNTPECALAVVVVSEEYLTRSSAEHLQGCEVLPLFWGLSRKEFRNPQRGQRWRQQWEDTSEGVDYVKAFGEARYRQEVVATVCRRLHLHEEIDVENGRVAPSHSPKGWCYYLRLVLVTPVVVVSVICVGSVLYAAFFCDEGYPSPYGIIFPTMT